MVVQDNEKTINMAKSDYALSSTVKIQTNNGEPCKVRYRENAREISSMCFAVVFVILDKHTIKASGVEMLPYPDSYSPSQQFGPRF